MTGTIKKRDIRRLYNTIKKRSPAPFLDSGYTNIGLPSFSDIKYAVQNIQPKKIDFLTTAWNTLGRFRVWIAKKMYKNLSSPMKKLVKKFARIEALIHKKIVCLEPRLKRRYGLLVYPEGLTIKAIKDKKKNIENFIKDGDVEDAHVEYIEDCFADMERPRFGWRAKITLMENEPCEIDAENPERSTCKINSISNNEDDTYLYAQSRQTGENFRSAAPPDCRIEYVCNTPPAQRRIDLDHRILAESNPVQLDPVQPDAVEFNPVHLDSVQPDPAEETKGVQPQ